jgi:hypothetical protein
MAYTMKTKRKVIRYAEEHGNRPASREFNVDEATIRQWRKQRDRIFVGTATKKSFRGRKNGVHVELEQRLNQVVQDKRAKSQVVTRRLLRKWALEAAEDLSIHNFKASDGWCTRFMTRHGLALRRRTSDVMWKEEEDVNTSESDSSEEESSDEETDDDEDDE